jgi:hypothetical protein
VEFVEREKRTPFLDFMKRIDIFGEKISLTHKKNTVYKTRAGAIVSLVLLMWIGRFMLLDGIKVYNQTITSMNVDTRAVIFEEAGAFRPPFGPLGFHFSFGFARGRFGPKIGTWKLQHVKRDGYPYVNGKKTKKVKRTIE